MKKSLMVSMVAAGMALAGGVASVTANASGSAYHVACYDGNSFLWAQVTHKYSEASFYARNCNVDGYTPKITVLL